MGRKSEKLPDSHVSGTSGAVFHIRDSGAVPGFLKSGISGIFQIAELILTTAAGVYAWILKASGKKQQHPVVPDPFFLMGSLIFVFVDIGRFVPSIG